MEESLFCECWTRCNEVVQHFATWCVTTDRDVLRCRNTSHWHESVHADHHRDETFFVTVDSFLSLSAVSWRSGEWQISVQISAFGTGNTSEVKNDVILIRMYYVINGTVWRAICHAWRHHITFPALTTITTCQVGNGAVYIQLQQWNWIYTNAPRHGYINTIRGRFAVPSANKGGLFAV